MNHDIPSAASLLDQEPRRSWPVWYKIWVMTGVALGLLMVSVTGASASTPPWMVQPTPPGVVSDPVTGVSCVSASDCVAVGDTPDDVLGWNGTAWSQIPYPSTTLNTLGLNSVACTSARYCIAVGKTEAGLAGAWAWNGSTWTEQSAYNPASTNNVLNAISCQSATRCEAVGAYGNGGTTYPLAEVWNGTIWKDQSTSGAPPGLLHGVACESTSKCEAVGQNTYTLAPLALSLQASKWVTQATPEIALGGEGPYFIETAVSCWSSGCTAVGGTDAYPDGNDAASSQAFAEFWNGRKWALRGTVGQGDPPNSGAVWNAVQCQSATECTAVGAWADGSVNEAPSTLVSTWNGQTWTQQSSPDPASNTNELNGIACTNDGSMCETVGWAPPSTLAISN